MELMIYLTVFVCCMQMMMNIKAAIPFNEKGIELIDQAIVKKEQMLKKVHESV